MKSQKLYDPEGPSIVPSGQRWNQARRVASKAWQTLPAAKGGKANRVLRVLRVPSNRFRVRAMYGSCAVAQRSGELVARLRLDFLGVPAESNTTTGRFPQRSFLDWSGSPDPGHKIYCHQATQLIQTNIERVNLWKLHAQTTLPRSGDCQYLS